jgi:hypothetical protein
MEQYFKIIRQALQEGREKEAGIYYEAHHIIPKSFGKKSTTVLLTPEEHYTAHKVLAEYWKHHNNYGRKMLWAFHRLSYDGKRQITEEQYGEARRILQDLWKREKTEEHRKNIGIAQKGNTNNSSRVFKGMKSDMSKEGRQSLAQARKEDQTGKTGLQAKAAKGPYTVLLESGQKHTAGSYPELSKLTGIAYSTLQCRLKHKEGIVERGWLIRRGE